MKEEGGLLKLTTSGLDQLSVTGIRRNVKTRTHAAESLHLIYLNKWKHPMLAISRLRPRNSESKWVGVLCEIQDGVQLPAYKSILYKGDLINFLNNMGSPMR